MNKLFLFFLFVIPFFLNESSLIVYEPFNYILFLIIHLSFLYKKKELIFSPTSLFVFYITLNYSIGSFLYSQNMFDIYLNGLLDNNLYLNRIVISNSFLLVSVVFMNYRFKINKYFKKIHITFINKNLILIYAIFLFLFFSIFEFNLNFLGGDGSLSNIPKSLGAIILFIYASKRKKISKNFIYISVFLLMSFFSFEDKREAILLIITYFVLEFVVNNNKFKFVDFIKTSFLGIISITLVLLMSIKRGYGDFYIDDSDNIFELYQYIPDYISSDLFLGSVSNNFEISYVYVHSNRAIDYAINNNIFLAGSTFIKPFFLFIPRSIYNDKPQSMIDNYTRSFSSSQRNSGVSWPVNFISEFFWNFSYFGFLIFVPFLLFFNTLYFSFFEKPNTNNLFILVIPLFLLNQWIVLFRGSGLEQFLLDFLLSLIFISPLFNLTAKKNV